MAAIWYSRPILIKLNSKFRYLKCVDLDYRIPDTQLKRHTIYRLFLYLLITFKWMVNFVHLHFLYFHVSFEFCASCVIHWREHSKWTDRYSLVLSTLIFPLKPNFGHLVCWCLLFLSSWLREQLEMFALMQRTAQFNRVERLVDSLSSATLTSCDNSILHVRLELIDELQETFLTSSKNWISRKLKVIWARDLTTFSLFLNYQWPPHNCFRTQNLRMVLLTVLLALSSVSLDIGQPYCRLLSFRNSLEAMRSLSFILSSLRS